MPGGRALVSCARSFQLALFSGFTPSVNVWLQCVAARIGCYRCYWVNLNLGEFLRVGSLVDVLEADLIFSPAPARF